LKFEEERALASIQRMKMCAAAFASAARRLHPNSACALFREKHRGVGGTQVGVEFDQIDAVESFIHRCQPGAKMASLEASDRNSHEVARPRKRSRALTHKRSNDRGLGSLGRELPAGEFNRA